MTLRSIIFSVLVLFSVVTFAIEEPGQNKAQNGTITIKTSKACKTLVETWATAYMQLHPEFTIVVTSKQSAQADLVYVNAVGSDVDNDKSVTYVGRYAILPITSSSNPIIEELQKKEWSKNDLKKLYFSSLDEELDDDDEANSGKAGKLREKLTVYSGANASSAASVFASHFGFQTSELRGNKISGDDLYLLNAIDEDKQSITFNNLAYLYDTANRQLKGNVAILPLNVKKDVEEVLQAGNLDATLQVLEQQSFDIIPVENFGFSYDKVNLKVENFLEWVVSAGQEYNNKNGFLKLNEKDAQIQLKVLAQK